MSLTCSSKQSLGSGSTCVENYLRFGGLRRFSEEWMTLSHVPQNEAPNARHGRLEWVGERRIGMIEFIHIISHLTRKLYFAIFKLYTDDEVHIPSIGDVFGP